MLPFIIFVYLCVCVFVLTWAYKVIQYEIAFFNKKWDLFDRSDTANHPHRYLSATAPSSPAPQVPGRVMFSSSAAQTLSSSTHPAAADHTAPAKRCSGEGEGGVEVPL